jgi:shikimate kinase
MECERSTPKILIAGPSGSGKSTLATAIASELHVPLFSLDDVFIRRGRKIFVETESGRVRSFEHPELYDGPLLAKQLAGCTGGFVAEGFCLFQYPEMLHIGALRCFMDVPFDTCVARRAARRPARPSDVSFCRIGRMMDTAFVRPQAVIPGVRLIDGTRPIAVIAAEICAAVRST